MGCTTCPAGQALLLRTIFRYEATGREIPPAQQFGCEAIGAADATLDAEIIDMAWTLYALWV